MPLKQSGSKVLELFSVMSLAARPQSCGPVTDSAPESVKAPLVVTFKVPETVEAPISKAPTSLIVTLLPLVMIRVEKLLALSNVMLLAAPAAKVVVPVTDKAPESVIAPAVVTLKVPETVDAPRMIALVSVRATLRPEVMDKV